MTPRGARWISLLLILLLLGFGWYRWAKTDLASDTKENAARQAAEVTAVRTANRELLEIVERARKAMAGDASPAAGGLVTDAVPEVPAGSVERTARTRALMELVRSGQLGQVTYPAPSVYKVATKVEKLAEVLGLSAGETDTLRDAANAVANELLTSAKVTSGGDQVVIEMGESAMARQKFSAMRDTFRQILGEEGMAAYEALGFRDALEASLTNLGLGGYTMTVSRAPAPDGNATVYKFDRQGTATISGAARVFAGGKSEEEAGRYLTQLQNSQKQAQEAQLARGGPGTTGVTVANRAALDSRLGPLAGLLPPGF